MEEKKLKYEIKVFEDDSAELLEGESLKNFIKQKQLAFTLLSSHGWSKPEDMEIRWIPLKGVRIER